MEPKTRLNECPKHLRDVAASLNREIERAVEPWRGALLIQQDALMLAAEFIEREVEMWINATEER